MSSQIEPSLKIELRDGAWTLIDALNAIVIVDREIDLSTGYLVDQCPMDDENPKMCWCSIPWYLMEYRVLA